MAMSYYGAYASQQTINRAGKPVHPDLYADEVPVAMRPGADGVQCLARRRHVRLPALGAR